MVRRRWLGPPTSFEAEVQIISGGRITIPSKIITAFGLEKGNMVRIRVTARREPMIDASPVKEG